MKRFIAISTAAAFFLLGTTVRTFAQEEHHDEAAKPAEHEEAAKPAAHEEAAKPPAHAEAAKPARQEEAKPPKQEEERPAKQEQPKTQEENQPKRTEQPASNQQQANGRAQEGQRQYAKNGQKDSRGHVYNESHFGPSHSARFEANGGRFTNGRREYSSGGYWFYASSYPPWFYQQNVYFIMGADGFWYAVSSSDPSLIFQVEIG